MTIISMEQIRFTCTVQKGGKKYTGDRADPRLALRLIQCCPCPPLTPNPAHLTPNPAWAGFGVRGGGISQDDPEPSPVKICAFPRATGGGAPPPPQLSPTAPRPGPENFAILRPSERNFACRFHARSTLVTALEQSGSIKSQDAHTVTQRHSRSHTHKYKYIRSAAIVKLRI